MIVYIDILFFKEILFNSIIIFLTAKITNQKVKSSRLIISSLFGAIYSTIIILAKYTLSNNSLLRFICATIMNLIVFKVSDIQTFSKNIVTFYLVTFVLGGVELYVNNHSSNLLIALTSSVVVIPVLVKQYKNRFKFDSYYGKLHIDDDKKKINIFIDTGNNLTTCYGEPVIILSNKYRIEKIGINKKIRRITYKTISQNEVVVEGVKFEKVILEYQNKIYKNEAVLINSNVCFEDYDAILGLNFFESAQQCCEKEKESLSGYFIVNEK